MEFDIFAGILRMNDGFTRSTLGERRFTYDLLNQKWSLLKNRYSLDVIAGNGDDFAKAANLLHWLSVNTVHKGDYDNRVPENALDLLNYTFGQALGRGVNCRALSIILTECCLAIGLPARTVSILPASPYDGDNHVVTIAYVRYPGKWVMLDPTWNAFCLDEAGRVLNPWEIRSLLAERGTFRMNPEAQYNDHKDSMPETVNEYRTYLAKDLFYLHCPLDSTCDPDRKSPPVFLAPDGFDVHRHRLLNIEYRINCWGPHPLLQKWLEDARQDDNPVFYASLEEFSASPYPEESHGKLR